MSRRWCAEAVWRVGTKNSKALRGRAMLIKNGQIRCSSIQDEQLVSLLWQRAEYERELRDAQEQMWQQGASELLKQLQTLRHVTKDSSSQPVDEVSNGWLEERRALHEANATMSQEYILTSQRLQEREKELGELNLAARLEHSTLVDALLRLNARVLELEDRLNNRAKGPGSQSFTTGDDAQVSQGGPFTNEMYPTPLPHRQKDCLQSALANAAALSPSEHSLLSSSSASAALRENEREGEVSGHSVLVAVKDPGISDYRFISPDFEDELSCTILNINQEPRGCSPLLTEPPLDDSCSTEDPTFLCIENGTSSESVSRQGSPSKATYPIPKRQPESPVQPSIVQIAASCGPKECFSSPSLTTREIQLQQKPHVASGQSTPMVAASCGPKECFGSPSVFQREVIDIKTVTPTISRQTTPSVPGQLPWELQQQGKPVASSLLNCESVESQSATSCMSGQVTPAVSVQSSVQLQQVSSPCSPESLSRDVIRTASGHTCWQVQKQVAEAAAKAVAVAEARKQLSLQTNVQHLQQHKREPQKLEHPLGEQLLQQQQSQRHSAGSSVPTSPQQSQDTLDVTVKDLRSIDDSIQSLAWTSLATPVKAAEAKTLQGPPSPFQQAYSVGESSLGSPVQTGRVIALKAKFEAHRCEAATSRSPAPAQRSSLRSYSNQLPLSRPAAPGNMISGLSMTHISSPRSQAQPPHTTCIGPTARRDLLMSPRQQPSLQSSPGSPMVLTRPSRSLVSGRSPV
eukprot:gnl/MRDRNA2_/MRDRNA2_52427_c0_seq1.p1 gnl/MRDRNA2_/MRDRNA2_52427_c0~~gnl/MRDRNA2_/MRDRNA2_52427_c0_seq1.p1  ORF type:complete len:786 (-),score=142.16 gnl/MRDRNA2_/MRDRNA2_52427_c0_seq1:82-2316(-)